MPEQQVRRHSFKHSIYIIEFSRLGPSRWPLRVPPIPIKSKSKVVGEDNFLVQQCSCCWNRNLHPQIERGEYATVVKKLSDRIFREYPKIRQSSHKWEGQLNRTSFAKQRSNSSAVDCRILRQVVRRWSV